jgi:hypothetical protein
MGDRSVLCRNHGKVQVITDEDPVPVWVYCPYCGERMVVSEYFGTYFYLTTPELISKNNEYDIRQIREKYFPGCNVNLWPFESDLDDKVE